MTTEIELKLSIAAEEVSIFLQQPILLGANEAQRNLLWSSYFDTATLELMHQHAALRIRRAGELWIQTIKIGGTVIDGMHTRPEWEVLIPDNTLYPALFTDPVVCALLSPGVIQRLQPVFQTEFWRTTWCITHEQSHIEIALDQGSVSSQGRSEAICELELELKSGEAAALSSLARILSQHITLTPDSISKAQRGYALYQMQSVNPC